MSRTQLGGSTDTIHIPGNLSVSGSKPAYARSELSQESLAEYVIPFTALRKWNDFAALLPATPLTDDLGIVTGTWATDSPSVQTEDLKAAGLTTSYFAFSFGIPPEYDSANDILIRAHAGMLTTVSDTTATIDFECFETDEKAGIGADLVTTAATTINSLTLADKDFVVTNSGIIPGDELIIRCAVAINDGATGTAVKGIIGKLSVLLDIRG